MGRIVNIFNILELRTTLPDKYADNDVAMAMIKDEIANMAWEIEKSEKGQRSIAVVKNKRDGEGMFNYINTSTKSTFPTYLQRIFNNKGTAKKFLQAVSRGKGKVWDRIALEAIKRLEQGYKNQHGFDEPDKAFIDVVKNPVPF